MSTAHRCRRLAPSHVKTLHMSWSRQGGRPRGYHHGNLKETLIRAALELIAQKGPAGFTFAEAARWAGVSPAAPYRHFRDRDELLIDVARRGFDRFGLRWKALGTAAVQMPSQPSTVSAKPISDSQGASRPTIRPCSRPASHPSLTAAEMASSTRWLRGIKAGLAARIAARRSLASPLSSASLAPPCSSASELRTPRGLL
jgi:AcrR family transcriptional regulator